MMILIEVVMGTARSTPGAPHSQPHKKIVRNTIGIEILRRMPTRVGSRIWAIRFWRARRLTKIHRGVIQLPNWIAASNGGISTAMNEPR